MKYREYSYTKDQFKITYDYPNDKFILKVTGNKIQIEKIGQFVSWIFSPTSRCDGNCDYCFADHYTLGDSLLTAQQLETIAKDASEHGLLRCDFSGGEAFLRDDLEEIIAAMIPYVGIVLTTSARNINTKRLKEISQMLPFIQISLDGYTDSMNAPRNIKVSKLIKSIGEIIDLGMKVRILTVAHKYNYRQLAEFGIFLHNLGVWEWKVINVAPVGKANGWDGILDNSDIEIVKQQLVDMPIPIQIVGFERNKQRICIILEDDLHLHIDRDNNETDLGLIDLNSPFILLEELPGEDSIIHLNYYLFTHSTGKIVRA